MKDQDKAQSSPEHNGDPGLNSPILGPSREDQFEGYLNDFLPDAFTGIDDVQNATFKEQKRTFIGIALFLEDRGRVEEQLVELERRFKQWIDDNEQDAAVGPYSLHRFLAAEEAQAGFNEATESDLFRVGRVTGPVRLFGVLPAPEFMELIRCGFTWDDTGIEGAHGRLTHRIQWCLIAQEVMQGRVQLPPGMNLNAFYRSIAEERFVDSSEEETIWDFIVDCIAEDNPTESKSYLKTASARSPENLNTMLKGSQDFKVLSSALQSLSSAGDGAPLPSADYLKDILGYAGNGAAKVFREGPRRQPKWSAHFHHTPDA